MRNLATVTVDLAEAANAATKVAGCVKAEHPASLNEESFVSPGQGTDDNLNVVEILSPKASVSWVKMVEEEEKESVDDPSTSIDVEMENDGPTTRSAFKRKKVRHIESDSLEDSAFDAA